MCEEHPQENVSILLPEYNSGRSLIPNDPDHTRQQDPIQHRSDRLPRHPCVVCCVPADSVCSRHFKMRVREREKRDTRDIGVYWYLLIRLGEGRQRCGVSSHATFIRAALTSSSTFVLWRCVGRGDLRLVQAARGARAASTGARVSTPSRDAPWVCAVTVTLVCENWGGSWKKKKPTPCGRQRTTPPYDVQLCAPVYLRSKHGRPPVLLETFGAFARLERAARVQDVAQGARLLAGDGQRSCGLRTGRTGCARPRLRLRCSRPPHVCGPSSPRPGPVACRSACGRGAAADRRPLPRRRACPARGVQRAVWRAGVLSLRG